jgi:hypothetical protein
LGQGRLLTDDTRRAGGNLQPWLAGCLYALRFGRFIFCFIFASSLLLFFLLFFICLLVLAQEELSSPALSGGIAGGRGS